MNEYKSWPDDKLISTGKRLKELIAEARTLDLTRHQQYVVVEAMQTLNKLREEYKKRKTI